MALRTGLRAALPPLSAALAAEAQVVSARLRGPLLLQMQELPALSARAQEPDKASQALAPRPQLGGKLALRAFARLAHALQPLLRREAQPLPLQEYEQPAQLERALALHRHRFAKPQA